MTWALPTPFYFVSHLLEGCRAWQVPGVVWVPSTWLELNSAQLNSTVCVCCLLLWLQGLAGPGRGVGAPAPGMMAPRPQVTAPPMMRPPGGAPAAGMPPQPGMRPPGGAYSSARFFKRLENRRLLIPQICITAGHEASRRGV
jgi:hypothetical protein